MQRLKVYFLITIAMAGLVACTQQTNASPASVSTEPKSDPIDQSDVCVFRSLVNTGRCQVGQKLVLLPEDGFAREELSLMFASQFCDMRYAVVVNSSGVTCIYYPTTAKAQQTPASADAAARAAVDAFDAAEKAAGN